MQEQRSKEIYQCICKTNTPIGQIAEEYGFSNAGHLSTFCRKFWDMTPMKLRAKARREEAEARDKAKGEKY